MLKNIVEKLNDELKESITGFKALSFCDIESRDAFYTNSLDENFDIELISAYNLDVVRTKLYALDVIGVNGSIKDIVVNLDTELHFISVSVTKKYFIYVAVEGENIAVNNIKDILSVYILKIDKLVDETLVV